MSNEDGNCFQNVDVMLKVALQPLHTSHPLDAVKQQLNNMLFKYNESVDGIPLSYSELSFPKGKEYARIIADQFWLHVDVCTKLLIFKPVVGQSIRGKVNKVAENNVSILILALFNATLNEAELSKRYTYSYETKTWQNSDGEEMKEGDTLEFRIAYISHATGVVQIDGALV